MESSADNKADTALANTAQRSVEVVNDSSQSQTNAVEHTAPAEVGSAPAMQQRPLPLSVADLREPQVLLSEAHKKTCRLLVGDKIEDATVTDVRGTDHQLSQLVGDHLTVLIFWSDTSTMGLEQFRRIPIDVLADFAPRGVHVIAAHVGGEIGQVRNLTGNAVDKITSLIDAEGVLFGRFATGNLPRTYVIDAEGKILWFDLEYSQSTQRSLRNALAYYLSNS